MRQFFRIFKMDFVNLIKSPVVIAYNTLFVILFAFIMGYLFSGDYASAKGSYNYYAVTTLIFLIFIVNNVSANSFMEEDVKKPNLRIIFSPVGSFPIYFSKIISSALVTLICHVVDILLFTYAFGLDFGDKNVGYIILMMIPLELASSALGIMLCCIIKNENATNTVLSIVMGLMCILGGIFYPLDGFGGIVAKVSSYSPAKWVANAFFRVIYDGNISYVAPVAGVSFAAFAVFVLLCAKFFRTEDYVC